MIKELSNKKVAILGWGIDTEDVVPWLLSQGANITVFDKKDSFDQQEKYPQLKWHLGSNDFGDLSKFDMIVRAPGIYRYRLDIVEAEKRGVQITSKTKLFFEICPAKIIGVTGTKGKGTTSTLIYEMLKAGGKDVYLGGNIGVGIFDLLPKLTKNSWVVLELSSFQLIDLERSPHIGVVLMVTSEHLDWHPTVDEYVNAKKNIVAHQREGDLAVINKDYPNSVKIGESATAEVVWVSKNALAKMHDREIGLRGEHNRENIVAAATVAHYVGIPEPIIRQVIKDFKGLPFRLEEVGLVNGVTYINDSFSTTPETTIAAIKSFKESIVLIVGGSEKGSDFSELGKTIVQNGNVRAVIVIGLMAGRIKKALQETSGFEKVTLIEGLASMPEIVSKASELSKPGDVVLLSPAAASFDMFKNYKDRGNQFKGEVAKLGKMT